MTTKHAATLATILAMEAFDLAKPKGPRLFVNATEVANDALALIRIGKGVARWAVRYCNGEGRYSKGWPNGRSYPAWGDEDDAAKEKADAKALAKLQEIADRYGATVKLGGDPRGYVVKLILASGRHNTWGGAADGWGVA